MAKQRKPAKQARTFLGRLMYLGVRRGVLGGSRPWLVTGAAAATVRFLHRLGREGPTTVFAEELEAGEAVEIRVLPPKR